MNVIRAIRFAGTAPSGRKPCAAILAAVLSLMWPAAPSPAHDPGVGAGGRSSPHVARPPFVGGITLPDPVVPPPSRPDTLVISFIGDVMLHARQMEHALRPDGSFDFSAFLSGIAGSLAASDLAVAGMEFTLAGKPYTGYPSFSAPDAYADYVADCGVDVFLTANNHILDKGAGGLRRTLRRYGSMEDAGKIRYTGCEMPGDTARNPLILPLKGIRLAIVNCTYGTNSDGEIPGGERVMRMDAAESLIRRARSRGADFVIACPHWGVEYALKHGMRQETLARRMAEWGADIIIGAHPHVVQDREVLVTSDGRRVPVYYSIGNAVSNMSARNTQLGQMVGLRLVRDGLGKVSLLDVGHRWTWCALPGELSRTYVVVFADECPPREAWLAPAAYDKMAATVARISRME